MAKAHVAFYLAEHGNIVDKSIAWYTNSKFSHTELVFNDECYSTSPRDLKIRKKHINLVNGRWHLEEVQIDELHLEFFFKEIEGAKYDWLGIFLSQFLPLNIHNPSRWFCSEFCAEVLKFEKPNKYSPQKLFVRVS